MYNNYKVLENEETGAVYKIYEKDDGSILVNRTFKDDPTPQGWAPEESELEFHSATELEHILRSIDGNTIEILDSILKEVREILKITNDEMLLEGIKRRYKNKDSEI